mmetsp:Transcript_66175/g.158288  ORF Transcript_66175/g.158288 Transcript_66175/m.158288 type:complete len:93 (-) Transcript_66175:592-870(-)
MSSQLTTVYRDVNGALLHNVIERPTPCNCLEDRMAISLPPETLRGVMALEGGETTSSVGAPTQSANLRGVVSFEFELLGLEEDAKVRMVRFN